MPTADREGLGPADLSPEELAAIQADDPMHPPRPAPPPTPVRGSWYLTECEHCGWVGSSEHCRNGGAPDYDDIICPVCCLSMAGDAPNEADTAERMEAERDEAQARAEGDLAAGNEVLRAIGTFDRTMKVGKHQATNYVHLRAVIAELDAAGHHDAADTLIWQVWHRVNSVARAQEFARIDAKDKDDALAEVARLSAEVKALRAALEDTRAAADDLVPVCLQEGDSRAAGALQFVSGFISDRIAALTRTTDQPDPGAREGSPLPVEAAAQEGQTR